MRMNESEGRISNGLSVLPRKAGCPVPNKAPQHKVQDGTGRETGQTFSVWDRTRDATAIICAGPEAGRDRANFSGRGTERGSVPRRVPQTATLVLCLKNYRETRCQTEVFCA